MISQKEMLGIIATEAHEAIAGSLHQPCSLALPALNDDIKEILSMMPWNTARIARRLDELKIYDVKRKCEDEQATALYWMLALYLAHGKEWRAVGEKILKGEAPENDPSSATRK